ncbi:MAG TPA: hypothetical protein VD816_09440 [Ohtaekwangia sp.]|nr:hypothetical protein [Ohtaekwangia sp.]
MTADDLKQTLSQTSPPSGINILAQALWHDAKGDWDRAHDLAQDVHTDDGSWVHAYLHRKEGDAGNAAYWYHRAGKPVSRKSLDDEWTEIVSSLLR